jgi:N-acetyl-anhydromuramyl-L-alanine amidase AmpD
VCYEGGLDAEGHPADTRTPAQKETLRKLLLRLKTDYPNARMVGHRDLPDVKKACPCFDAEAEYQGIGAQYQREMRTMTPTPTTDFRK